MQKALVCCTSAAVFFNKLRKYNGDSQILFYFFYTAMRQSKPSFNPADTNALVSAVAFGKGLSKCRPPGPVAPGHQGQGSMMSGGPTLQQVTIGGGSGQQAGMGGPVAQQQQGQTGRRLGKLS